MIHLYAASRDEVIKSSVSIGQADYTFALENLVPLLDRFHEQRKAQNKKFYSRLRLDILRGCIMPPITLAFVSADISNINDPAALALFVNDNIEDGYILDGMQRLLTLQDASADERFDPSRPIYMNVVIAEKYDLLLYRMITLNNGQKPMTARHQIEMLTKGLVKTDQIDLTIVSEKETETKRPRGAFKESDIVEAYIAFLANSVNNQNSKIIESKLDEILVGKVMSSNLDEDTVSFSEIMSIVSKFQNNDQIGNWMRVVNNLIGFTVGVKKSYAVTSALSEEEMTECLRRFDTAFDSINPSKVNVGRYRRELSQLYFERLNDFKDSTIEDIEAAFFEATLTE